LTRDAFPRVFKWNDETNASISRAIPFIKKSELQNTLNSLSVKSKSQEVQCSLEEDKLKQELYRKNIVIRQLLQRLGELEDEAGNQGHNSHTQTKQCIDLNQMQLSRPQSPEMPTLTPFVVHEKTGQEIIHPTIDEMIATTGSSAINNTIVNYNTPEIQPPICKPNSTQTLVQRVSVIKKAGSCSSSKNNNSIVEIAKPPKKRKYNYF
jgi:hypothetical protein